MGRFNRADIRRLSVSYNWEPNQANQSEEQIQSAILRKERIMAIINGKKRRENCGGGKVQKRRKKKMMMEGDEGVEDTSFALD